MLLLATKILTSGGFSVNLLQLFSSVGELSSPELMEDDLIILSIEAEVL